MYQLRLLAVLTAGFALSACDESPGGYATAPGQGMYAPQGYGSPAYAAGPYPQPGYVVPYGYQPGYGRPPAYQYSGGRRDYDHDGDWQRHGGGQDNRRPAYAQPPQNAINTPHGQPPMAAPPRPVGPPPPAAASQAAQNRKLLDNLGFRPSQ